MISLVQLLREAQDAPKAVILAGAPGAGKSSVVGDTLSGLGLKVLNIDDDFIANLKNMGVSLDLKKADAEGERLLNLALARLGGTRLVALEAARNIRLKEFVLSSKQFNPIDLKEVYELLDPGQK